MFMIIIKCYHKMDMIRIIIFTIIMIINNDDNDI